MLFVLSASGAICGQINASGDGYELTNLVQAIQYMRGLRPRRESVCSSFADLPK